MIAETASRVLPGAAKCVRWMPHLHLRGCMRHLVERAKTVAISAFSGDSSISEGLFMSSEPNPRPSSWATHSARRLVPAPLGLGPNQPGISAPKEGETRIWCLGESSPYRSVLALRNLHRICRFGMRRNRDPAAILTVPSEEHRRARCPAAVCMAPSRGDANCRPWTKTGRRGSRGCPQFGLGMVMTRTPSGGANENELAAGPVFSRSSPKAIVVRLPNRSTTVVSRTEALAPSTRSSSFSY